VFWWIGASGLIAAAKGLCVILHRSHSRILRPWEDKNDIEKFRGEISRVKSWLPSWCCSMFYEKRQIVQEHNPTATISAKERMKMSYAFDFNEDGENKFTRYEENTTKAFWRKVFQRGVWVQEERLRVLQDRIILGTNLWAGIGTIVLLITVLSVPRLNILQ
jgi:hypothetical protein